MPPRILIILRQETAVGYYRQELPSRVLKSLGYTVDFDPIPVFSQKPSTNDWLLQRIGQYDIVLVDRGGSLAEIIGDPNTTPPTIGYRGIVDASHNCRMICDFDDNFLDLPKWNESRKLFMPGMAYHVAGLAHLQLSEMTTVSTPQLLTTFTKRTHAIRCAPNHIDPADWAHPTNPARSNDPNLRIFYGGASGHYGDLAKCETALKHLLSSPPVPFRFIAFNAIPRALHDIRRQNPKAVVSLPWVPFYDTQPGYRRAMAWGGFDIAIAPLADHPFNHCRSKIKFLEAAVMGQAFIASKIGPYADIPTDCAILADNTTSSWSEGLTALLTDASLRQSLTTRAKEYALDNWHITQARPIWQEIIETTLSLPRIETFEDTLVELMDNHPEGPAPQPQLC